eukprot:scaffold32758_cov129-Isochrysis_galbana.AAC.2
MYSAARRCEARGKVPSRFEQAMPLCSRPSLTAERRGGDSRGKSKKVLPARVRGPQLLPPSP